MMGMANTQVRRVEVGHAGICRVVSSGCGHAGRFFGVFLLIFLFAMAMLPIEKSLSKVIWEMTAPPKRKTPAQEGGFKTFSQKQQQKPGR